MKKLAVKKRLPTRKLTPQARLYKRALDQIIKHPESWTQGAYNLPGYDKKLSAECGTSHCIGGWIIMFANKFKPDTVVLRKQWNAYSAGPCAVMMNILGLNANEGYQLIGPNITLTELIDFGNTHFKLNYPYPKQ